MRISQRIAAVLFAVTLSVSLAGVASAARGQQGQSRARAAAAIPQVWLSKLNLTPDQQVKLQAAGDTYRADMGKARSLTNPDEKRAGTRQARKTYRDAMQAVLTPVQQHQLEAMRAEARDYRDLGAVGNQLVGLNLTDEQKGKIKGIAETYRPKLQELHTSLQSAADKKPVRDQIRDLRQKMVDEVKAVLTPEQAAQLVPAKRSLKASR